MRTFEYRLFVNREQSRLLLACLAESRVIYNGMLEMVRAQYEGKRTFPKLSILTMVHNHCLAKSIMDASWGTFLDILSDKAARAGHEVIRVNPRFTSQICFNCGEIVQKSLSVRTHLCPFCSYVADRDVNAAQNILQRARPGHGLQELTYTDGCSVS